jgi:hypothetical protein
MSIHSTGRPPDGLIPNQKDVVATTVERENGGRVPRRPDVLLTPAQAAYFLHTGEDLEKVARLSEAVAVGKLAGGARCVPLSSDAGPEERTAALKALKEQLRVSRESPFLAATKCRDHLLGTGQAAAWGRRTPWARYEIIEPVELCGLTVAGPHAVNRRGDIAFYDVRISGRDLWEVRQAAVAAIAAAEIKPDDTSEELRRARDPQIDAAITAVYDKAEKTGAKPPNIRELPEPVQKELREKGRAASGMQIMRLADDEKHRRRRRKPGKTLASEKRKADFTK